LKYPFRKWIYIDVDGTFSFAPEIISLWARQMKDDGYKMILWSARGQDHAKAWADAYNCADIFEAILSKPGHIVDDQGWKWIKYTNIINKISVRKS